MKALLSRQAGGPESLVFDDIAEPVPAPGELRIRVRAVGVNYPDFLVIQDLYQYKPPRPFAPGAELAGEVDAVGAGVTGFAPGDRVLACPVQGAMAEKAVARVEHCWRMPAAMSFEEAAALVMTYGTSQHALAERAQLRAGETVLVLGAGGGVGLAAVQLARALGARVVAAASSAEKLALAREYGAQGAVEYPRGALDKAASRALSDAFKEACGPGGADVIYDAVGGDYTEPALRAIAWAGRHLVVGFPAGIPRLPLNLTLLKSCQVVGVFYGESARRFPAQQRAGVDALLDLYVAGRIRPAVTERFPLARGAEAIARLGTRQASGKIVVTV